MILDRDPLAVPPEELRDIRVLETWKDGAAIFRQEARCPGRPERRLQFLPGAVK